MPRNPPLPIGAVFTFSNGTVGTLVVTFDIPLLPGLSDIGNWIYHHPMQGGFAGTAAGVVAGNTLTIPMSRVLPIPDPPSRSDYLATPPDIFNLDGIPAAAFVNFPTTIF